MSGNINLDYLESIQGKAVKVFKGGPESRKGQLLSVKSDYLVLNTNDEGVVIYQTGHIKSVIEDSTTSMNTSNNESVMNMMSSLEGTNNFAEVLTAMKGSMVRIDRGGPEARNGRLLDVKGDYLILYTDKDGVVYYQLEHVKSLSKAVNDNKNKNQNQEGNNNQATNSNMMVVESFVQPEYMDAENFTELLTKMRYKWVTINRGGPESMKGVLADSSDGHLVLICEKEVCRISTFHIRNISYVLKQENNQNAENQNQDQDQQNSDNNNQNQNNESNNQKNNNNSKKSYSVKMYSGSTKSRL